MVKKFKNFWIEYFELYGHSLRWLKRHWLGYIILTIIITAIAAWSMLGFPIPKISNKKLEEETEGTESD